MRLYTFIFSIVFTLFFSTQLLVSQEKKVDTILGLIEKAELFYSKNLDSSIAIGNKALKLSLLRKDSVSIANSYRLLAIANFYKQNYDLSEKSALNSLEFGNLEETLGFKLQCYQILAGVERRQGDFNKSLFYYKKTLELNEDPIREAGIMVDMGTLYIENGEKNLDVAKLILKEALTIYSKNPDKIKAFQYVLVYDGLSKVSQGFEESLGYSKKSIAYAKNITSGRKNIFLARSYSSIAFIYSKYGFYNEAIYNFNKVLLIAKKIQQGDILTSTYKDLAFVCYKNKYYDKALRYLDSIVINQKIIKTENFYDGRIDSLRFSIYSKLKKIKEANVYAKKTIVYLDSVNKEKNKEAYLEFGRIHEVELKEKENVILRKDNEIQALNIVQQERSKNVLYVSLFLTAILLAYLTFRYRKNLRAKRVLKEKNTIIKLQKEDLQKALTYSKEVNNQLTVANNTKEKLFGVIAHDLINPFNAVLGYTNLLLEDYDMFSDAEKKETIGIINKASVNNHKLVKNLLDWSRSQQNRITVKNKNLEIQTLIEDAIAPYLDYAKKKNIEIVYSFELHNLFCDENILKTAIANLFFNAVKFTRTNHKIFISSKLHNNTKTIEIKDEGVGISKPRLKELFNLMGSKTTTGTANEKGSGLGLIISKEFIEIAGGTFTIKSKVDRGTSVRLAFD